MKLVQNQGTNPYTSLCFIALLLQSNVAALNLRTGSTPVRASPTELAPALQNAVADVFATALVQHNAVALTAAHQRAARTSGTAESRQLAGKRTFQHLIALQTWQRLNRMGVKCPKPTACECHCDCPATEIGPPPPSPTACPVYPNVWPVTPAPTAAPTTTAGPLTTTPAPKERPLKCDEGFVRMSDGTCAKITYETVLKLEKMVQEQRNELEKTQVEFNSVADVNCTSCPGAKKYFEVRPKLVHSHQKYLYVLKLFLGSLAAYQNGLKKEKELKAEALGVEDDRGPEFELGEKSLRSHCEPWTSLNETLGKPSLNFCGIICRQQPSCVGFGRDPKSQWCVWYDDTKPQSDDVCSSQTKTQYLKKWQGPMSEKLWLAIDKVHIFDGAMQKSLEVAKLQADTAAQFFNAWDKETSKDEDEVNSTLAKIHQGNLSHSTDYYGGTLFDTHQLRKQLDILRQSAYAMTMEEVVERPPFGAPTPPPKKIVKPKKLKLPEGLEEPLSDPPKLLVWKDFPNSQDTTWSQQHPDCPMGTPCFCDCKCRGAPPQNFVEPPPPPYPPPPCPPPPPLPPAGMLSDMMVAQSIR